MDVTKRRRRHSAEFKAEVIAACLEPSASVSAVARRYDLNDNMVHQWRRGRGVARLEAPEVEAAGAVEFIAMSLPAPATPAVSPADGCSIRPGSETSSIRLEIRRGSTTVDIAWPTIAATDCVAFLREWLAR